MKKNRKYKLLAWLFLASFAFKTIVLADNDVNCNSYGKIRNDLQNVFNLLKIIIPLLVIGLSTYDFIKAVAGKDEKDTIKAFQTFIKRMGYAILFFFLPMIINLLLELFETNSSVCIE